MMDVVFKEKFLHKHGNGKEFLTEQGQFFLVQPSIFYMQVEFRLDVHDCVSLICLLTKCSKRSVSEFNLS